MQAPLPRCHRPARCSWDQLRFQSIRPTPRAHHQARQETDAQAPIYSVGAPSAHQCGAPIAPPTRCANSDCQNETATMNVEEHSVVCRVFWQDLQAGDLTVCAPYLFEPSWPPKQHPGLHLERAADLRGCSIAQAPLLHSAEPWIQNMAHEAHARLASITSQILSAILTPSNRSSS